MFLLLGLLAALWERQNSGKGQIVDAAMVDGVPALLALIHSLRARNIWKEGRQSNLLDGGAPFYRCYECADGKFIAVGPLEPRFFAQLVDRAGLPEDHKGTQMKTDDWAERHETYEAIFRSRTREEWTALFAGSDACVTPVLNWAEAPEHPHLAARGTFVEIDGISQAAPAPRFSRTPADEPGRPPKPGGDTDSILTALGYDEEALERLRAEGVLS